MEAQDLTQRLADQLASMSGEPVAHQIVENLWLAVVDGSLETGERLPTVRQMAIALGVSPGTVERAYEQLEKRGVLATRRGEGTFVSLVLPSEDERLRHQRLAALCRDTVERSRALGFSLDELLDALSDFRATEPTP
jgi:GntR family transcriptional regulator